MALARSLENLEGLDPAVAALYTEKDGKFFLEVDGLEDTTGLKSALEKERKDRKEFERKIAVLKDVDPEEYSRLKREAEDRQEKQLADKGEFEKIRAKWAADKKQEIETLTAGYEQQLSAKDTLLQKHVRDSQVRNAALEAGVLPDRLIRVMRDTSHLFNLDDEGNIRVLDDAGETTPMSLKEFFTKKYKEEAPYFYAATGNTGAGTPAGGIGGKTGVDLSKLSPVERMKAARAAGATT